MFGSGVVDFAIGMIFSFLAISLATSAVTEALASSRSWRADTLLVGVKELLNDQQFTGLARELYNHALVNPRANGAATTEADLKIKPSYIDARQFAAALIDISSLAPGLDVPALQQRVNAAVPDAQLNRMLNGIVERAGGNVNRIRDEISAWFDHGMERVAGAYKRKTQLWNVVIAFVLAAALDIDAVKIASTLWHQPMLMKDLPQLGGNMSPAQAIDTMQVLKLPFGWDAAARGEFTGIGIPLAIAGWILSALATLFGAPFWFDALQKFVQLRGAGAK